MEYQNIQLHISGGIARLMLNRPESLNALSLDMFGELRHALQTIESTQSLRVLVLSGAGRAFCAGADQTPANLPPAGDPNFLVRDLYNPLYSRIAELPLPKLAVVQGAAAGAGMSLALSCDILIAGHSAFFLPAFANQALVPDTGASWHLPRAIGAARATAFLMLNPRLSAQKAADWGLIWACVEDSELQPKADEIAQQLANGPTVALAQTARLVRMAGQNSYLEQLQAEMEVQGIARATHDRLEARSAFTEKRKPRFSGR